MIPLPRRGRGGFAQEPRQKPSFLCNLQAFCAAIFGSVLISFDGVRTIPFQPLKSTGHFTPSKQLRYSLPVPIEKPQIYDVSRLYLHMDKGHRPLGAVGITCCDTAGNIAKECGGGSGSNRRLLGDFVFDDSDSAECSEGARRPRRFHLPCNVCHFAKKLRVPHVEHVPRVSRCYREVCP